MDIVYVALRFSEMFLSAKEIACLSIGCLWMADTSLFLESCHPRHLIEKEGILVKYSQKQLLIRILELLV